MARLRIGDQGHCRHSDRRRNSGCWPRGVGCQRYFEEPIGPLDVLKVVEDVVVRPPLPGDDQPDHRADAGPTPTARPSTCSH